MEPFDSYPMGGRALIGIVGGGNSRRGYGLKFMRLTGQTRCAYCDFDLTASYRSWLQLALDHVVPESVCKAFDLPNEWTQDSTNKVLVCSACNGFRNRYRPPDGTECPTSLEAFYQLRDQIFAERRNGILMSHQDEEAFYSRRPWKDR